jgi:hypothetical protein
MHTSERQPWRRQRISVRERRRRHSPAASFPPQPISSLVNRSAAGDSGRDSESPHKPKLKPKLKPKPSLLLIHHPAAIIAARGSAYVPPALPEPNPRASQHYSSPLWPNGSRVGRPSTKKAEAEAAAVAVEAVAKQERRAAIKATKEEEEEEEETVGNAETR